nr:hypothetical protein [Pseudomonas sp. 3MA1]
MPLTEEELLARDAKRNIGQELLDAIIDVKAGRQGHSIPITKAAEARGKTGLSNPNLPNCLASR